MSSHVARPSARQVVIAGGGAAAMETLLALRAQPRSHAFNVSVVAPHADLVYRPLAVGAAFGATVLRRYRLDEICADLRASLVHGKLVGVDGDRCRALLHDGSELPFDALVVATGARRVAPLANAYTFSGDREPDGFRRILAGIAAGTTTSVAFVVPASTGWSLPLYELALQTAQHASSAAARPALTVVTPEDAPLAVFRGAGSDAVRLLLELVSIDLQTNAYVRDYDGRAVWLAPGERKLPADVVVALPRLQGPAIDGLPSDHDGFIPVDADGRVTGYDGVYAVGDAIAFAIKQGGLATQQADHVAALIAGGPAQPRPPRPHLRAILLTGGAPLYLTATIAGGETVTSTASRTCPWWPPRKIAARYLSPYLADRTQLDDLLATPLPEAPEPARDVTASLEG
jgi:sulfide:quinone oxidoreductase